MKIGFDNDKYLKMQSEHIRERIGQFGNKLYLEFGGKLFDDYHASRVLPGFEPDSKLRMLMQLSDQAEIVIVISANDIDKNKVRGDLGITYDEDVLRLMDEFTSRGLYVGSVCITQYSGQESADLFKKRLEKLGIRVYKLYLIPGYPSNTSFIVSDEGYGKNDYIETTRPLVVITAPGPGSGKMATCLSQLYHEYKRGVKAGYAKFETFPIWNLPLKHPVNLAYEAATADLNDVNMIDPFHLDAYGITTVNYNRDVEIFPVLRAMFEKIMGECPYKSPTDMGVNLAGSCIVDNDVVCAAARQEIQFGCIQRPTTRNDSLEQAKFEVCCHKYADLSEPSYGVALLNDCKYGVSVEGGRIALSLAKGGMRPDPRGDEGVYTFRYAFLPHTGGFCAQSVVRPAYAFQYAALPASGEGLPSEPLVRVDAANVMPETVKPCEDGGHAFILRLYECEGSYALTRLSLAPGCSGAQLCDMLEQPFAPCPAELEFRPFEIKTLRITYTDREDTP